MQLDFVAKRSTLRLGIAVGVVLIGSAELARAAAFQNGSFETPQLGSAGTLAFKSNGDTSITGWVVATPGGTDVYQAKTPDPYTLNASDGSQVVTLNNTAGTASISQTFDTMIGTTYTVQFDLSRETPGGASSPVTINVSATGTAAAPYVANAGPWVTNTYIFTATATSTSLTFGQTGGSSDSPVLDNVRVTVPEPASLSLLGLGGLGLLARRRRV